MHDELQIQYNEQIEQTPYFLHLQLSDEVDDELTWQAHDLTDEVDDEMQVQEIPDLYFDFEPYDSETMDEYI